MVQCINFYVTQRCTTCFSVVQFSLGQKNRLLSQSHTIKKNGVDFNGVVFGSGFILESKVFPPLFFVVEPSVDL